MVWWVLLAVAAVAIAVLTTVRWWRLRHDVARVLARAGLPSRDPVSSRALYRVVRGLERRVERAEADAARLRAALEGSELGVVVGDVDGRIVVANPSAVEILGGTGDTIVRTRLTQLLRRVAATGEAEEFELDVAVPHRKVLSVRVTPLEVEGTRRGALGYLRDLTRRSRVEAMRRDFVANAGHELKTPLGALTVLAEALATADDERARARLARRLAVEAERMAMVVDDIVQLAAVESLANAHEPVRVEEVLAEAVGVVSLQAAEAEVALVEKFPAPDDAVVLGVREHLVSAVVNLLSNAVKYTAVAGDGGTVWYGAVVEGEDVRIVVEDHGIGIPLEHQERIFERFYRVDRARSRASGGTGLGLSIVRNVARTHGGEVAVESMPGEGSTFTLTVPLHVDGGRR